MATGPDDAAASTRARAEQGGARSRHRLPWFGLAAAILALDLWTKWLVFYPIRPVYSHVARVCPGFDIIVAYNPGVTFGLAAGAGRWVIALATSLVIATLVWTLWSTPRDERVKSAALAVIVGGAVGNLYDRTLRPMVELDTRTGVRDFLDWYAPDDWALAGWLREHFGKTHWYTSNVADVFIVCGVIVLAWLIVTERHRPTDESDDPPETRPDRAAAGARGIEGAAAETGAEARS